MPSAPGRVKMPHNNRVSTGGALHTSSIWKQTIGHDPYGDKAADAEVDALKAKSAEQAKGLLELARHQNLANTAGRVVGGDDFAKKMFLGLKRKKLGRDTLESSAAAMSGDKNKDVADSSSSEDEFIEVVQEEEQKSDSTSEDSALRKRSSSSKKRKRKSSKKKKRKSASSSSEDESRRHRKKRGKKHGKRREKKKRRRTDSSSSSSLE